MAPTGKRVMRQIFYFVALLILFYATLITTGLFLIYYKVEEVLRK